MPKGFNGKQFKLEATVVSTDTHRTKAQPRQRAGRCCAVACDRRWTETECNNNQSGLQDRTGGAACRTASSRTQIRIKVRVSICANLVRFNVSIQSVYKNIYKPSYKIAIVASPSPGKVEV